MQSIDECDEIPRDDSPTRPVVGKRYNTLMTQAFNAPPPIWDIREFEIKGTVGSHDKEAHINQDAAMMRPSWA